LNAGDPQEVLRAILADPEFDAGWQEQAGRWLAHALRAAQRWLAGLPAVERWALLGICVAILGWLGWSMVASYREMKAPHSGAERGDANEVAVQPAWRVLAARAQSLASEGRLREAARALQQAVYSLLAARGRMAWDGARADWEWVTRLNAGPELAAFTEEAQSIAYGGADPAAARYESLRAVADLWLKA